MRSNTCNLNGLENRADQPDEGEEGGNFLTVPLKPNSYPISLSFSSASVPTASVSFRGKNIVIRTLIPLPDEEDLDLARDVTISYIDLMEHTDIRRKELLRRYIGTVLPTWHARQIRGVSKC